VGFFRKKKVTAKDGTLDREMSSAQPVAKWRNPLMAEKTPRKEKKFNFGVPEVPENLRKVERWNYPSDDWGLMAKFTSQQPVYNKIYDKKKHYEETVAKFRADKLNQVNNGDDENKKENNTLNSEFKLTSRIPTQTQMTARTQQSDIGRNTERSTGRKALTDEIFASTDNVPLETVLDNTDPNNLYNSKISGFKGLAKYNPEILAKWRAKRAAEFVLEQKHPLDPPTARDLTARPFKPGGSIPLDPSGVVIKVKYVSKTKKPNNSKMTDASGLSTSRMQGTLGELLEQLNQTQCEIERQELKIALKTKSNPFGKK